MPRLKVQADIAWSIKPGRGRKRIDNPKYNGKHYRVYVARGKATEHDCEFCSDQAQHWATVHGTDGLDVFDDYMPLCRRCHWIYDGQSAKARAQYRENGRWAPLPA